MPFSPEFLLPQIPLLEKIVRPLLVYIFLLIAFRVFGKRQLGQLTPFDFIVLLTISNVVQNAMIGGDNSLIGGIIGALTILVANFALAYLSFRFPRFEHVVEGDPTVLIENGQILLHNLKKELVSEHDLRQTLVRNQIDPDTDLPNLKILAIDPDGQITIVRTSKFKRESASERE
jgi:uncharacterized membrane protein YcaP (DUF421 family)